MKALALAAIASLVFTAQLPAQTPEQFFLNMPFTWKDFGYHGHVRRATEYLVQYWDRMEHNIPTEKLKTPRVSRTKSTEFFPIGKVRAITYFSGSKSYLHPYAYDSHWHIISDDRGRYTWDGDRLATFDNNLSPPAKFHQVFHYDDKHRLVESEDFRDEEKTVSDRWVVTTDGRGSWTRIVWYMWPGDIWIYTRQYDTDHHLLVDAQYYTQGGKLLLMWEDTHSYESGYPSLETYQFWSDGSTSFNGPMKHFLKQYKRTTYNDRGLKARTKVYLPSGITDLTPETLTSKDLSYVDTYHYDKSNQLIRETVRGVTYTMTYDKHGNLLQQVEYRPLGPGGSEEVASITDYVIRYFDSSYPTGTLNDANVRIRLSPNLKAFILPRLLQRGEKVRIVDETQTKMKIGKMDARWYEVETEDGLIGWSYGAFIDR